MAEEYWKFGSVVDPKEYAKTKAKELDIPWDVADAHATVESNWNPSAKSQGGNLGGQYEKPSSAKGIYQLIDSTAKEMGVSDPLNPYQNIDGGLAYLKQLHDKYGDWEKASMAFKQGPASLDKNGPDAATLAHMDKLRKHSETLSSSYFSFGENTKAPTETPENYFTFKEPETSPIKEVTQAITGTAGVAADLAPYFAGPLGLLSQGLGGLGGLGRTGIELAKGKTLEEAVNEGVKTIQGFQQYTTPTNLAKKFGVPEELINNKYSQKENELLAYIPEKAGELGAAPFSSPEARTVGYVIGNFTGNAVLWGAAGGAKNSGASFLEKAPNVWDIFHDNVKAAAKSTFAGRFGKPIAGDAPTVDIVDPVWFGNSPKYNIADYEQVLGKGTIPTYSIIGQEIQRLQDKPLPSKELQDVLSRDPKSWSIDDKLILTSWQKEVKELNQLGATGGTIPVETGYAQISKIIDGQLFWSFNPVKEIFNSKVLEDTLDWMRTKPFSTQTETIPTQYAWAMRSENAGLNPGIDFGRVSKSVEKNGIQEPVELTYSINDHSFVVTDGNTRIFSAMRENLPEVPVYVKMVQDHTPANKSKAVSADLFAVDQAYVQQNLANKHFVKPTEIGIPGRDLTSAASNPLGKNVMLPTGSKGDWYTSVDMAGKLVQEARRESLGWNAQSLKGYDEYRGWEQYMTEVNLKEMQDISSKHFTTYEMMFSPTQVGELSKHPVLKWASTVIGNFTKMADFQAKQWMEGTTFAQTNLLGRKSIKAKADPNSFSSLWRQMSGKEKTMFREMDNAWSENRHAPTMADFQGARFTPKMISAYQAVAKSRAEALKQINDTHKSLGMKEVQGLEGFSPSVRQGDFFVRVLDSKGNDIYREHVRSTGKILGIPLHMWGASRLKDVLQRDLGNKFPGSKVEVGEMERGAHNPFAISVLQLDRLSSYVSGKGAAALKALGIDPNAPSVINELIEAKQKTSGFSGHKMAKNFVPGQKGSEYLFSDRARNNSYFDAQATYFREASTYNNNLLMSNEINKASNDPRLADMPQVTKLLQAELEHAKGAYELGGEDKFLNSIINTPFEAFGFGPSTPRQTIEVLNKAAYFSWLHLKGLFYASQIAQPTQYFASELSNWRSRYGMDKVDMGTTYLKGLGLVMNPGKDAGFLAYMKHGLEEGILDPQLTHRLGFYQGENPLYKYSLGEGFTGQFEKFGRIQTAAMAYSFFKDNGITGEKLHNFTDIAVNNIMTDFHRSAAPSIYKSGMYATQMAGVLSRFHHNFVAQFVKYTDTMKETGDIRPIAYYLGFTALMAGATGMMGVKEADWFINKLREHEVIPANWGTVSEWAYKHLPDAGAFGILSHFSDSIFNKKVNLSSSMAAPNNVPNETSLFPSLTWGSTVANALWQGYNPMRQHSWEEKINAAIQVTPTFGKGLMEKYGQYLASEGKLPPLKAGEVVPEYGNRGVGGYRRDEGDWDARMAGTKSLEEIRERGILSAAKETQKFEAQKKGELTGVLSGAFKGQGQEVEPIIKELLSYGMAPKDAVNTAVQLVIQQKMDARMRQLGIHPDTISAFHKFELMKKGQIPNE